MPESKHKKETRHPKEIDQRERALSIRRKEPFFARMEVLIQKAGSAAELARLARVSESAIRKWKAGDSEPTVDRLVRLAKCTGVDVGWLATGEEPAVQSSQQSGWVLRESAEAPYYGGSKGFDADLVRAMLEVMLRNRQKLPQDPVEAADFIMQLIEASQEDREKSKQEARRMLAEGPPQPKE